MEGSKFSIDITGDSSKFRSELSKAVSSAQSASKSIAGAFGGVQGALAGIGVSLSVAGFAAFIKSNIDALDRLSDLSQIAGISATKLGGIGFAAKQSGVDMDVLSKGIKNLNLELAKAAAGDEGAKELFAKLNIDPAKIKSADQALVAIAGKFATYEDGANKAALAAKAFGAKSGTELIPLLNQGGESLRDNIAYFEAYSGVNDEIVAKANTFNDSLDKLSLLSGAFGKALTAELLPSLQGLVNLMVESKEKGDGFAKTARDIVEPLKVLTGWAVQAAAEFANFGNAIGFTGAALEALARGDFARMKALWQLRLDFIAEKDAKVKAILDAIEGRNGGPAGPDKPKTSAPPSLTGGKAAADADAAAKALVAQQLRFLENSIRDEQDILKNRESYLELYYKQDLVSIADYYNARRELEANALRNTLAAFDQQIAVLEKQKTTAKPGKDRIEIETKIGDAVTKRGKAERDAALDGYKLTVEQTQATQKFLDKVTELGAKIAEQRGNLAQSAAINFDLSNKPLQDQIEAQKLSQDDAVRNAAFLAEKYQGELRRSAVAQGALNEKSSEFALILDELATAQGRVALDRTTGASTELESLARLGQANVARIADLTRVADAYREIAVAAGDTRAIAAADAMQLKIEQLAATSDLLADKFRDIFVNSFADGLASVIDGTKSLKDAFHDMERSIVQSISRIAANNLAEALFGGKSSSGGGAGLGGILGGFFSSLFGGSSAGSMYGNAYAGALTFAADGTDFAKGGATIVGELGPELVNQPRGSQVVPNSVLMARRAGAQAVHVTNNITVGGNTSRATADQIAVATSRAVQRAVYRNT